MTGRPRYRISNALVAERYKDKGIAQVNKPRVCVFFTKGMSLARWEELGILKRELALYDRYIEMGWHVQLVTYGGKVDAKYRALLPQFDILHNRFDLPELLYALWVLLHFGFFWNVQVIKTNQLLGADLALRVARLYLKPLVVRCGYLWSRDQLRVEGWSEARIDSQYRLSKEVFNAADQIIVTSNTARSEVVSRVPSAAKRIQVIPNFVDTQLFSPYPGIDSQFDLVFVGRIAPQKNLEAILDILNHHPLSLLVIGEGQLSSSYQSMLTQNSDRIAWLRRVPNNELPKHLAKAKVFVLPSLFEGHPKVLIEAMSCAMPVVASRSPGVAEFIEDGETGIVVDSPAHDFAPAISRLLKNPALRSHLGENARKLVLNRYDLNHVAPEEERILANVMRLRQIGL